MANQQDLNAGRTGNGGSSNGERGGGGVGERASGGLSARTHEGAEQLKGMVSGQVEQARQRAASAKDQAAQRIRRVAMELRHVGETLQPADEFAARVAQRASGSIDKVAGYVSSADVRQLRNDTESFARNRPAVFFGGAFLLGLALGRFFKSSAQNGGYSRSQTQGTRPNFGQGRTSEALSREQAQTQKGFSP
jgi:hypothetical protein